MPRVCGAWLCVHAVFQKMLEKPISTGDLILVGSGINSTFPPPFNLSSVWVFNSVAIVTPSGADESISEGKTQISQSFSIPFIPTTRRYLLGTGQFVKSTLTSPSSVPLPTGISLAANAPSRKDLPRLSTIFHSVRPSRMGAEP